MTQDELIFLYNIFLPDIDLEVTDESEDEDEDEDLTRLLIKAWSQETIFDSLRNKKFYEED